MKRWSAVFAAAAAVFVGVLVWFAAVAPDSVPGHFNAAGQVDRWDSKTSFLIVMVAVGGVVIVLFGTMRLWIAKMPASAISLPTRRAHAYWTAAERRPELDGVVATVLELIGAAALLLLAGCVVVSGAVAFGVQVASWVFPALLGGFLAATVITVGYALRRLRLPKPPPC